MPEDAHHPAAFDHPTLDELASHCFGCGPANPQGLHLQFAVDAEAFTATTTLTLTRLHEGPPGYIHGGIIAVLMDEAMSKLNRPLQALAMTRNMQVDYLRPSPLHQPLTLTRHTPPARRPQALPPGRTPQRGRPSAGAGHRPLRCHRPRSPGVALPSLPSSSFGRAGSSFHPNCASSSERT